MSTLGTTFPGTRTTGETLYRAPSGRIFSDVATLEAQYDIEGSVSDFDAVLADFERRNVQARAELQGHFGIPYGPTVDERLDVFPGPAGGPVIVFIHGGYWRSLNAEHFSFIATGLVKAGATVVVTNYSLCPTVTIDEIVRQHRAAIAWCHRHVADYGGDPGRLAVVGHSAGAHGVAMTLLSRWVENYGLPPDVIRGACVMSGLFDLRPLAFTSQQQQLRLTAETVLHNSPILTPPDDAPPLLITYGLKQTDEFLRQSTDYASTWRTAGLSCDTWPRPDHNHFDELIALTSADSDLVTRVIGLTEGRLNA